MKGSTQVNCKHDGCPKNFRLLHLRTYLLLSHFQNDSATVECSTLVLLQMQFYAFRVEKVLKKRSGEGTEAGSR